MKPKISMVTLGVRDLDAAYQFYHEGLGFPSDGVHNDICFFPLDGAWLAIYPVQSLADDANIENETGRFSGMTLARVVSSKEEVDKLLEKAKQAGATITDAAHDRDWGGYSGYFRDLDGYVWEVAWNPEMPELVEKPEVL